MLKDGGGRLIKRIWERDYVWLAHFVILEPICLPPVGRDQPVKFRASYVALAGSEEREKQEENPNVLGVVVS